MSMPEREWSADGLRPDDAVARRVEPNVGSQTDFVSPTYHQVEIGGFNKVTVVILTSVLVLAGVGDFVNAKTVFDLVFPGSASYLAWTLAISITVLAVIATHAAGYLWKEAGKRRALKALATAVLTAWLGAGVLIAVLRVAVSSTASSATSSSNTPFAGLNAGTTEQPHALGVAAVLFTVWLMTGLISFAVGYLAHAPAGSALERIERRGAKISKDVAKTSREGNVAGHALALHQRCFARLPDGQRLAIQAADAHRDELLAWARLELARVLGDPAATNDILPRPPVSQ